MQRFLTNIAKQKIQLQLETFLKMNQIIVVAGENVERIILIKVTRPKNMRKTLDLLTIIRKLNHPMIKQVNSQSPKYKYSLTRLCITFTQNVITDQNIFFSPKLRS